MADNGVQADHRRPSKPSRASVHILQERRGSQQFQPGRASTSQPPHLIALPEKSQRPSQSTSLQQRRASMWMRRPSMAGSHRMWSNSSENAPIGGSNVAYENTYQLEPNANQKFYPSKVEPIIDQIMQSFLDSEVYEASKCSALAKRISDVIKARIKELGFTRHRIVSFVAIGQKRGQTLRCASRCLWDKDNDGFASVQYSNNSLFATATVYVVYFD